ncbi:uncharacterized protein [Nicotiana tomentosiformis]|uniref:uncharacterized protein n=1 Tax=Nicotiana tomentosiformis TaxID=4098 RepID=UPI00051C7718|nr:SAP30-binding protein-like [Nicotiana tomentosiformis]
MASEKKESEAIALLSIYGDEDDDMEEEEEEYRPESQNVSVSNNRIEISSEPVIDVPAKEEQKGETDLLEKWLPPPPKEKCSDELQEKIIKLLALKKTTGTSFNAELRNKKEYRNPDLLLHTVKSQETEPIGSRFDKAVFDPHGYDKTDFYDAI